MADPSKRKPVSPIPVHRIELSYTSRTDSFRLWLVTDNHLGNRWVREDLIRETVRKIKDDPLARWIDTGDKAECIVHNDKRFDPEDLANWIPANQLNELPKLQAARYVSLWEPVKDKCLGLIEGNHEATIRRQYQNPLHGGICAALGVPDLGHTAVWLKLVLHRESGGKDCRQLDLVATHGTGGATTPTGRAMRLAQALRVYNADLVFLGHLHDRRREVLTDWTLSAAGTVVARKRVAVCGGTFLETANYSLLRNLPPAEVGAVCVEYWPNDDYLEVRL